MRGRIFNLLLGDFIMNKTFKLITLMSVFLIPGTVSSLSASSHSHPHTQNSEKIFSEDSTETEITRVHVDFTAKLNPIDEKVDFTKARKKIIEAEQAQARSILEAEKNEKTLIDTALEEIELQYKLQMGALTASYQLTVDELNTKHQHTIIQLAEHHKHKEELTGHNKRLTSDLERTEEELRISGALRLELTSRVSCLEGLIEKLKSQVFHDLKTLDTSINGLIARIQREEAELFESVTRKNANIQSELGTLKALFKFAEADVAEIAALDSVKTAVKTVTSEVVETLTSEEIYIHEKHTSEGVKSHPHGHKK